MNNFSKAFAVVILIFATRSTLANDPRAAENIPNTETHRLQYPQTRKEDLRENLFGVEVHDPYRWLEDGKSPNVSKWVVEEANLTRTYLDRLPKREELAKRLMELTYYDSFSEPFRMGNKLFYSKRLKSQEKGILYSSDLNGENEKIILNLDTEIPKTSSLGSHSISFDGSKMAYIVRENNADEEIVYVRDLKTGLDSKVDAVSGLKYDGISWNYDGTGFFYEYFGKDKDTPSIERIAHATTRFHRLGQNAIQDEVVFGATHDAQMFPAVQTSWDGRWAFVSYSRPSEHETVFAKNLSIAHSKFEKIFEGNGKVSKIEAFKDDFYILTNVGAPRFHLLRIPTKKIQAREVIIPEDKNRGIEGFEIIGGRLVVQFQKNVSHLLEIRSLKGKLEHLVHLPDAGTVDSITGRPDEKDFYFYFDSFLHPYEIFKASVDSGKLILWEKLPIPVDTSAYEMKQVWYKSKDGTRVPMFLVYRKNLVRDGNTPFILYGYGGFASSFIPSFNPSITVWLENGGGYALANIRGGGEFGEKWHLAGKKEKKQNVFDDFISAAEFLHREKYTRPEKLAISGGSNGGLLVGAVMTQRPDLMKAVICDVPVLDMIRFPLVGDGKFWTTEWGSPTIEKEFKALYAYSPYHHIKEGIHYPSLLLASSRDDDRVDPMHARKFVAALQAVSSATNPILLRIEQSAGHGGGAGIRPWINTAVDKQAFLMDQLRDK